MFRNVVKDITYRSSSNFINMWGILHFSVSQLWGQTYILCLTSRRQGIRFKVIFSYNFGNSSFSCMTVLVFECKKDAMT